LNYFKKLATDTQQSFLIIDDDIEQKRTDHFVCGISYIEKIL